MTQENDTAQADLFQIRKRQAEIAAEITEIIDRDFADNYSDLACIRDHARQIVSEIDEILNRQKGETE